MAQRCIFCGTTLSLLNKKMLLCGNVSQPVCPDCYQRYEGLSQAERGRRAIDTGRALEADRIRGYLLYLDEKEKQAQARRQEQQAQSALRCLRCGGAMISFGCKHIALGEAGILTDRPLLRDGWFASWLDVEVFRCADCGRAEFFLPEPPESSDESDSQPEPPQAICPVCGTRHDLLTACPVCTKRQQSAGRSSRRPGEKPPWEK